MGERLADFLINTGLYGKGMNISKDDLEELRLFLEGTYKIDAYCRDCDTDRVFTVENKIKRKPIGEPVKFYTADHFSNESDQEDELSFDEILDRQQQVNYENLIQMYRDVQRTFSCAKEASHTLTVCCLLTNDNIIKYGQYPSLADLNNTNSKKYRKILGEKYLDYNKGLGLHSHGIGAGSLVYLRRIFEDLIEEAYKKASKTLGWDEESYPSRMDEKILTLKDYLPKYLVENRKIYGILSKGIHELPEDICIEIFPVVRVGIEFILDEKIEEAERERKKKDTAKLLEKLSARL